MLRMRWWSLVLWARWWWSFSAVFAAGVVKGKPQIPFGNDNQKDTQTLRQLLFCFSFFWRRAVGAFGQVRIGRRDAGFTCL